MAGWLRLRNEPLFGRLNRANGDVLGVFQPVGNLPGLCGLARKHLANPAQLLCGLYKAVAGCAAMLKVFSGKYFRIMEANVTECQ